jgi:leader peptidase (prepilin peptidase)/N-methyltransferase
MVFSVTGIVEPAVIAIAAIFGAIIGSFFNVVIYRLPLMMEENRPQPFNLVFPQSHCCHCGRSVRPVENIPVISYVALGGRCSNCHEPISIRYPLVELLTAAAAVGLALRFGTGWEFWAACIFVSFGICITFIDLDHLSIPNVLTFPLIAIGLAVNTLQVFTPFRDALIGAATGFASLWILYWGIKLATGKEALGFGDFKLFAAMGAWLGWQMLPLALFIACAAGSVIGLSMRALGKIGPGALVPFGPFLVVGGIATMMWGHELVQIYLSRLGTP